MTTEIPTDAEAIVIGHLSAQGVASGRVYTDHPDVPVYPYAVVRRLGGGAPVPRRPLDRAVIQVDVWAKTKDVAHDEAATAWARIHDMKGTVAYGGQSGVVTGIGEVIGLTSLPEAETGLHRYMFQSSVYVHP